MNGLRYPDFFVVGAPKCGTTSAADYLRQQSSIFIPRRKEPNYYCGDLPVPRRIESRDTYLKQFAAAPAGSILGEASSLYLYSKIAIRDAFKDNPRAKFIALVRNPMDMVYSWHRQLVLGFVETETNFETAWSLQHERRAAAGSFNPLLLYGEVCKLSPQIARFYETIPAQNRLVMVFDDIIENPLRECRALMNFLGIAFDEAIVWPHSNPRKTFAYWGLAKFLVKPPFPLNYLRTGIRRTLDHFPNAPRHFTLRLLSRTEPSTPITDGTRQMLAEYFEDDVWKLGSILNRDFSAWLR